MANEETIQTVFEVVDRMSKKVDSMSNKLDEYGRKIDDVNKKNKKGQTIFDSMSSTVLKFGTVLAGIKIAKTAVELGELGAKAQFVDKNFQKFAANAGKSVTSMTEDLRTATQGMVSDLELQQFAMQSMISGVKFDDMLTAMQFVSRQAIATGANVSEKMRTVMTGFARGSAMFLDDVGIQVMGAENVVGAAVEQMKEKMGLFADAAGTAKGNIENTKAEIQNLKSAIGDKLTPVTETWNNLVLSAFTAFKEITVLLDGIGGKKTIEEVVSRNAKALENIKKVREAVKDGAVKAAIEEIDSLVNLRDTYKNLFELTDIRAENISEAIGADESARIRLTSDEIERLGDAVELLQDKLDIGGGTIQAEPKVFAAILDFWEKEMPEAVNLGTKKTEKERKKEADAEKKRQRAALLDTLKTLSIKSDEFDQDFEDRQEVARSTASKLLEIDQKYSDKSIGIEAWRAEQLTAIEREYYEWKEAQRTNDIQSGIRAAQSLASFISNISNARMSSLQAESNAEIKRVKDSRLSEKRKADAIKKINEQLEQDKRKAAMTTWAMQVAAATGDVGLAISSTLANQRGGAITKLAAALTIGAAATNALGTVIGAKPRFFNGGEVPNNGRIGDSQLAVVRSGERVLTPAQNRAYKVAQNKTFNNTRNSNVTVNATFNGGNMEEIYRALPALVARGIEQADRENMIDYDRMTNLRNAVRS